MAGVRPLRDEIIVGQVADEFLVSVLLSLVSGIRRLDHRIVVLLQRLFGVVAAGLDLDVVQLRVHHWLPAVQLSDALALRRSGVLAHLDSLIVPRIQAVMIVGAAPVRGVRHQSRVVLRASVTTLVPRAGLAEVVAAVSVLLVPGGMRMLLHQVSVVVVNRLVLTG